MVGDGRAIRKVTAVTRVAREREHQERERVLSGELAGSEEIIREQRIEVRKKVC